MSTREPSDVPGCRRGRLPREERLAARETARVREHVEAAERLKRKYA